MKARNLTLALLFCLGLLGCSACASDKQPADAGFKDEPPAHALYNTMVETMRKADTLSWVSDYRWGARGKELGHAEYKIWLKKPNYARVEAKPAGQG